jgi:hypothetical protein
MSTDYGPRVEIPLRRKYLDHTGKKQRSSHEGNPSHKRNKAKGDVLLQAQAQTAAHQMVKVLDGAKIRWMTLREWKERG